MKKEMFDELLSSVQEMGAIIRGEKPAARVTEIAEPEVRAVREKTGLDQAGFAILLGVSPRTVANWEQGRRHPTGPAKVLLRVVDTDPQHAVRALGGRSTALAG